MGSVSSGNIRDSRTENVPAYYQASDLAMRRDWYGLAMACRTHEITQSDAERIETLLKQSTLGDLVALDVQLQAAGFGQAVVLADSVSIDDTRIESILTVASSLERQVRQRYLAYQARRLPSLIDAYRQSLGAHLRRNLSYRFVADRSVVARETHRLVEVLHGGVLPSERPAILKQIVARDPQLLVHLLNGDYVTPSEARRVLQSARVAPLDKVRLATTVHGLYSDEQLKGLVSSLDLAALAQLRYESPEVISEAVTQRYVRQALADERESLAELPALRIEAIGRLVGLLGDDLEFMTAYKQEIAASLEGVGVNDIDELRQFVALTESPRLEDIQAMPIVRSYTYADALMVVVMLGSRFTWCRDFADRLLLNYADMYLSRAQQTSMFDERLSGELSSSEITRIYGELYRLSMRQKATAGDIATYVPNVRKLVEIIRQELSDDNDHDKRVTIVLLAYLVPALHDAALRRQLFTLMSETVYLRLLNESLAGSMLAQGFLGSLSKDEALQLVVRWGDAPRNGYLLKLLADANDKRYQQVVKELESRDIAAMALDDTTAVLEVLSVKQYRGGMAPEKSIAFVNTLIASYGKDMARRIVGKLGISRTEELADVSPFYMRLLVDALQDDDAGFVDYLLGLGGARETMTYEEATVARNEYHRQHVDFATRVLESLRRVVGAATA